MERQAPKKNTAVGLLLSLILVLGSVSVAADQALWVEADGIVGIPGERLEGGIEQKARAVRARPLRPELAAPILHAMRLEAASVPEKDAAELGKIGVPRRVGVHRQVPAEWRISMHARDLVWESLPGGGFVATLSMTSPEALALRVAVDFEDLPAGSEVRFYAPDNPSDAVGPFEAEFIRPARAKRGGERDPFWSPVIRGQSMAMEIFVPEWRRGEDVIFSFDRISHIYRPLRSDFLKGPGDSGSCNRNLSCSKKWQDAGDAVAMYFFESGGFTGQCTGQLIVDGDGSTQKPWFLTAAHCLTKKKEAKTMTFEFFYQQANCSGGTISTTQVGGGATLKATTGNGGTVEGDTTLVLMKKDPPAGVFLQGFSLGGDYVGEKRGASVSHPSGDHKKIALLKKVRDLVSINSAGFVVPGNTHYEVNWKKQTTTEPGSSGASLMLGKKSPNQFVIGVLTGGFAACGNTEVDFYGCLTYVLNNYPKFAKQLSLN